MENNETLFAHEFCKDYNFSCVYIVLWLYSQFYYKLNDANFYSVHLYEKYGNTGYLEWPENDHTMVAGQSAYSRCLISCHSLQQVALWVTKAI